MGVGLDIEGKKQRDIRKQRYIPMICRESQTIVANNLWVVVQSVVRKCPDLRLFSICQRTTRPEGHKPQIQPILHHPSREFRILLKLC